MQLTWLLLATVVAAVWSLPTHDSKTALIQALSSNDPSTRNSALENLLLDLIESLRDTIEHGTDTIPPLDPLHVASVELDDNTLPFPGARLALKDATVLNLNTFVVDTLSVNLQSVLLQRYRILLDARIPSLDASAGYYDLDLSAMGFNFYGVGDLKIKVINPRISTNFLVGLQFSIGGIFLNMIECTVQFHIDGFEPQINGLFGHQGVSDFVNLFLKDFVPSVVDAYEADITHFLSTNVHQIANEILSDISIGDLLP